ncbi:MAG: TRAP transporter small permease subunit [Desulfonatronovibrio sp. MSAO_Bac4]|nr:MAG: TRAP transporter small permease subunit [Desulfonatronovibrio sp. MSAO_Bac4]
MPKEKVLVSGKKNDIFNIQKGRLFGWKLNNLTMKILAEISSKLNRILLLLGALVLCLMMALATCNMFFGFTGNPIRGSYEITGFLGALAASLALAPTQQLHGHITVNIFDRFIPKKIRHVLNVISQILLLFFFILIIQRLIFLGLSLKSFGELSESLRIAYYPLVYVVAFGFFAIALTIAAQLLIFKNKQ